MKTQIGVYIEVVTADELRNRAARAGVPIGDLADLTMRYGLERLSDEALAKWAAGRQPTRGRMGGGLLKNELAVLGCWDRLLAKGEGAWRFMAKDIAQEAGLTNKDAYFALLGLQRRGLVTGGGSQDLDRWGRPMESAWVKVGTKPEGK
jgi:hypothetical protein